MGGDTIESIEKLIEQISLNLELGRLQEAEEGITKLSIISYDFMKEEELRQLLPKIDHIIHILSKKKEETLHSLTNLQKIDSYRF